MGFELLNFEEDVLAASHVQPVLVDFWAPWCGPCRTLGPIIEKLAAEAPEKWTLVKINSDLHPELSTQYDVKGIPAVKLFHRGKVIDEFTGLLPEYAIKQWLEKALPSHAKDLMVAAESKLEEEDETGAKSLLEEILLEEPTNAKACGLLARLLVFSDLPRAAELAKTAATGEIQFLSLGSAIAQIASYESRTDLGELVGHKGLETYLSAIRATQMGQPDVAIPLLIEVLQANRYLDDDGARKLGIALFTVLGASHPVTLSNRRTFDMWLY